MSAGDAINRAVRQRQWMLFSVLAGVVVVLFVLWMGGDGGGGPAAPGGIEAELATPGDAELGWVRRSETRLGGIEARLRDIETANRRLEQENAQLVEQLREDADNALEVIDIQRAAIGDLTSGAVPGGSPAGQENPFSPAGASPARAPATGEAPSDNVAAPLSAPRVLEFRLEDRASAGGAPDSMPVRKPIADYVPAGSYAEAVVIAGADASAAVQSQGDPRPVLMRLTSPAYGAAVDGVAARSDVEGCTVTGAAYGDLSSEKVYVRLQTMACVGDDPATVIETPVSGFVAGGGAAGVRGAVVSREGALVERAFMAGVFSGFGQSASQAFGPQAVLTGAGSATVANSDIESIGRAGLGSGAGTAGQQVSDYLIRRAEQYQPVIQLAAGTAVTVVFLGGAWLDGRGDAVAVENGS